MMTSWKIEYWEESGSSVEVALDQLTKEEFKSISKELRLLALCGNTLRLPHSRSLGRGLFELRERRFGYRVYYAFFRGSVIVLLHIGDKSHQHKDIILARKRLIELEGEFL